MKLKHGKLISIKKSVFFFLILIITVSLILNSIIWFIIENKELNLTISDLKQREIEAEKELLKNEVNKTLSDIKFMLNYRKGVPLDSIKSEILAWISKKRLVYGGYLFVNTTDGQALVYDGKKLEEYKSIKDMSDPNGLKLFDNELEAYSEPDGKFMEYFFKPLNSDIPEEKISFMKGYPDWGWIIGAGIYKKIPNLEIEKEKSMYYKSFKIKILLLFIVTFFLATIGYIIIRYIGNRLTSEVELLKESLKKAPLELEHIDLSSLVFKEIKSIGSSINQMIVEKKELEQSIAEKDESLKLVFKAAENVAIIITDLGGAKTVVKEFSAGAEHILNFKRDEALEKELSMLFDEESFNKFVKIQGLLAEGLKGFSGEAILFGKDRKPIAGFYTLHPLLKNSKVIGSILVIIDISKSKKNEEELRKLKDSLEQKVEERTGEIIIKNRELELKNAELENYNRLFIGREFRINELKQKINELESKLGNKKKDQDPDSD